jgi:vitamin B12/bleomycin/antimicrobial peptide transport system ATP-binding/permease protein
MGISSVSQGNVLDLVRAQIPVGAMSVGEIAQITAAFVVVLAPLNWLVDNCSGLADCLSSANRVAKDQLRSARAPE